MNIKLSERIITNRCGSAAANRGQRYFKENKVIIRKQTKESCEATVTGVEDFHVEINNSHNKLYTACSCPTLASFTNDCQHIAAVLYAILHKQTRNASGDLFQLFNKKKTRSFAAGSHFETRKELQMYFICHIIEKRDENLLALKLRVENKTINTTAFLKALREGNSYFQEGQLIFDPASHCFNQEITVILQYLLRMQEDTILLDANSSTRKNSSILIPPTLWYSLFPLLKNKHYVSLEIHEEKYREIVEAKSVLPLQFLVEAAGGKAQLKISGMDQLLVLPAYKLALCDGVFYRLTEETLTQLLELQKLLQEYNTILFSEEQLIFFSEKVVPKLKGIGEVSIAKEMMKHFNHPPLKAKLFLDRVNHRLLASLEFHYDYFVIHPLEEEARQELGLTIRDMETEKLILDLMNKANFYKTDGGFLLHNEALEYEFLYHILPDIEKYVQVYATTAVRNRILPQPVKPKIKIKHQKDRVNWLEFKFELEGFPEKEIKEILQALQEKRKYYRMRSGTLLSLESKEFAEIHDFLLQEPIQEADFPERFELPIVKGLKLIDKIHTEGLISPEASFQNFLYNISHPETASMAIPDNLHAELRAYQREGIKWMKTLSQYGFGGVLADDMGLGKTLQSIAYIASVTQEMRENNQQILIICPSSVMFHWQNELNRFAPDLKVGVIYGNKEKRSKLLAYINKLDVMITTYSMIRMDIAWYQKMNFHTIFFDEAQSFKNPRTQTARAVKKLQATNRFALTGTPIENTAEELWSIFHIVFPELFGSLEDFSHLSNEKIARRVRPFMLRRMKKDVAMELPKKQEHLEFIELYPEQKKIYAAYLAKLRHESLKHLDKASLQKNRIRILAGLTRLRQICCHPGLFVDGYTGNAAKFKRLTEIIGDSQAANRRILIFSQFTNMLELIARHLAEQGLSFFYLDGTTPPKEREEMAGRFNQGERDIFLISLKAGGTGLNLIGADTVILYDLWWNPAVEEQAADRAYRIGQENTVQVIKLLAKGTIEEKMYQLQERKRTLIKEIIEDDEQRSTALTIDDIKELLVD